MTKSHLFGASLLALVATSPAFAQSASPDQPQANNPADAEAANNDAEIIVTASKRAQTLQDTPISVAVATAASIEQSQVRDLLDLQTLVPSLKVGQLQSSANTNFIIRGFGNGANNAGIEPSVGVFIDGVYRSRSAAQIGDLPAIERVEVLRGPQSTLFGKNASAGIISIVTSEPKFEFGGQIEASYGNYNAIIGKAYVTGPLSETVAVSLAGNYNKRDGYARYVNLNNLKNNDRNRYGVRGQILFQPNSDFKIRIIGDYDRIDEVCCTVANIFDGPTGGAIRALGGQVNSNNRYSFDSFANFASVNKIDNYGVSGQLDGRIADALSVVSITAYRGVKIFTNQDSDFTSADIIGDNRSSTKIDTFTQELRLLSDFDGPVNFLLGGYYFNEKIRSASQLTFGRDFRGYANFLSAGAYIANEPVLRALNGIPATVAPFGSQGLGRFENYDYRNEAISIFGNIDFEITDGLTLSGGANYTIDRKRVSTNSSTTDTFSTIDLIQTAANAGIPGTLPPGTLGPGQTTAIFPRTTPCATGAPAGTCNPFLGFQPLQFLPPFLNFPNAVESGRTKDDNLSYTVRLAYKINRNLSTYLTYGTGFKATSFNLSTDSRPFPADFTPGSPAQVPAPGASPIRTAGLAVNNLTSGTRFAGPEKAQVYEAGLKGNWDGFSFNMAVFKQILKGFQSNVFVGTGFVLGNAPKQSTFGVEFDASLTPVRNLNFTFSMTYLDPKFDDFPGGTAFNPVTRNTGPANLTGLRPSGQSEYSIAVGATYTAEFSDSLKAIFHVDYDHSSSFLIAQGLTSEQAAGPVQGQLYKASPETLNGSITFALNNGLEFSVWGRNLTAPKYNPVIFPGVAQSGTLSGYPSPPAFYGASARFKF